MYALPQILSLPNHPQVDNLCGVCTICLRAQSLLSKDPTEASQNVKLDVRSEYTSSFGCATMNNSSSKGHPSHISMIDSVLIVIRWTEKRVNRCPCVPTSAEQNSVIATREAASKCAKVEYTWKISRGAGRSRSFTWRNHSGILMLCTASTLRVIFFSLWSVVARVHNLPNSAMSWQCPQQKHEGKLDVTRTNPVDKFCNPRLIKPLVFWDMILHTPRKVTREQPSRLRCRRALRLGATDSKISSVMRPEVYTA